MLGKIVFGTIRSALAWPPAEGGSKLRVAAIRAGKNRVSQKLSFQDYQVGYKQAKFLKI